MAVAEQYARNCAPAEILSVSGAHVARIECVQCGSVEDWRIATRLPPPDIVLRHFTTRGWGVRKRPLCQQCVKKRDVPMRHLDPPIDWLEAIPNLGKENQMTAKVTPITPTPSIVPTDAKAQRRDAHALIELTFDIGTGAYKDGYSDVRISKETGISETWVAKRREEEFGPLKVPDEIAELRRAITDAASDVGKLTTQLNELIRRNGWVG